VTLQCLNLSQTNLGELGLREILRAWRGGTGAALRECDISHNYIGSAGLRDLSLLLASGGVLPRLQKVDLSCNGAGDTFAPEGEDPPDYRPLVRLRHIRLFANGIGVTGAAQLARGLREGAGDGQTLEVLDLSWNEIRAEGLKVRARLAGGREVKRGFALEGHWGTRHVQPRRAEWFRGLFGDVLTHFLPSPGAV
jgi:Ran GTPase-activating protein (RanGAP) involved in mRNA processing and transport